MRMAIRLSEQNVANGTGGPFGAVIVKNGRLIAKSANLVTSTCDPTAHAEVSAIRLAAKKLHTYDLSGCVIYTSCEPCPMCLGAIYWAKIDRIYFANSQHDAHNIGFSDQLIYREIDLPHSQRKLPMNELLRDEAQHAFEMWKTSAHKEEY